jgi:hypothetical protein
MVPEQRLLSPEIHRRRRWSYGTLLEVSPLCFRVFRPEASYRWRGIVRGGPGRFDHRWVWPGAGPRPLMVRLAPGPPPALFRCSTFIRENKTSGTCFVQFREYFLCSFSKTQK